MGSTFVGESVGAEIVDGCGISVASCALLLPMQSWKLCFSDWLGNATIPDLSYRGVLSKMDKNDKSCWESFIFVRCSNTDDNDKICCEMFV